MIRPSLLLVGVVHRDPWGKTKLFQLLNEKQPRFISVEISPYSRAFRARNAGMLRATLRKNLARVHEEDGIGWRDIFSHGEIQGVFSILRQPYEWQAAEDYARKTGATLKDIDLSRASEEKLSHLPELVSLENLRSLLRLSSPKLRDQVQQQYRRARFLFAHPPSMWPKEREEREIFLATELRRIIEATGEWNIVHIGGWEHLLELRDGISLYGLLKDLHPERALLTEEDEDESCGPIYGSEKRQGRTCIHKICEKAVENFTN